MDGIDLLTSNTGAIPYELAFNKTMFTGTTLSYTHNRNSSRVVTNIWDDTGKEVSGDFNAMPDPLNPLNGGYIDFGYLIDNNWFLTVTAKV
jgi:hypothetical protein